MPPSAAAPATALPAAPPAMEISTYQRVLSASVGSMLTSLVVTPLEVAKVRMQAQAHVASLDVPGLSALECDRCTHYVMDNGLMEHRFPKPPPCPDHPVRFRGTTHALSTIVRQEGFGALYNGLQPTLWMAVPAQTLYFAMYDTARDVLLGKGFGAYAAPALAGAGARVLASSMVAPLELLRTKAQAETMPPSMLSMAARELRSGGPLVFWRGLSPTLWRDVPFSAIYWSTVEWLKPRLARDFSPLGTSALSGAAGGLIAAALTHPFDVVKTRRQVLEFARDVSPSPEERRTFGVMRAIVRRDGLNGLFVGLLPRVTKIIPGTAIMLSTYDFSKSFFAARPN